MESAQAKLLLAELVVFVRDNTRSSGGPLDSAVRDLRVLRFHDQGVLALLNEIAADQPADESEAQAILSNFDDAEWQVDAAAQRLAQGLPQLSHMRNEQLELIRYRKIEVQAMVKDAINHYL